MKNSADRPTEASATGVWLTTPRKRVVAAAILVLAALAFLILWDAELLWSTKQ